MKIDLPSPTAYQVLPKEDQQAICRDILAEVEFGQFAPVGQDNPRHWEDVWSEDSGTVPAFIKPAKILRVDRQFVRPENPHAELVWYQEFRSRVLKTYFSQVSAIYEFGCGNGWNLRAARLEYPNLPLVGLDLAVSAVEGINTRYGRHPWNLEACQFDFLQPDHSPMLPPGTRLKLPPGAGVWTVGALEQTGQNWGPFLAYLLNNRPAICVHIEPIVEWYDPKNPVDQTAVEYHLARNYWQGFPAQLEYLAARGKVEILEQKRSYFGSRYLEGYSLLVWKPL